VFGDSHGNVVHLFERDSEIEEATDATVLHQPEHHVLTVLHVYEVAHLSAVLVVGMVRAEKSHRLAASGGAVVLQHHAAHVAFVVLVRPVHVEELEAHPLRWIRMVVRDRTRHPPVEEVLAPTVRVHGHELGQRLGRSVVVETSGAIAIGCRG